MADMGAFRVTMEIESLSRPSNRATVTREYGYALVHAAGARTPDCVVFAKPGDMILLGARSLEGLNVRVDPVAKQLIPIGYFLAGAAQ